MLLIAAALAGAAVQNAISRLSFVAAPAAAISVPDWVSRSATNTVEAPVPSRSMVTWPCGVSPPAPPAASARSNNGRSSAAADWIVANCACARGVAHRSLPSGVKTMSGRPACREQARDALQQRQCRPYRLARCQKDRAAFVRREARTHVGDGTAEMSAEAAQTLEPLLARRRQCRGEPDDLGGRRVFAVKPACAARRRLAAEDRGADRVGPEDARSVGAPDPGGRRAGRMIRDERRQSRIARQGGER